MNFNDWAPLKLVDPKFLKRVRLCYVFGVTGLEALMVTDEDEVCAYGSNIQRCLGLKETGSCSTISLIRELNKNQIKGFSSCIYNDIHGRGILVFALTTTGTLYYWGRMFTHTSITVTPKPAPVFLKRVAEVGCGANHCLIVTTDGQVYSCGYNSHGQLGQGTINTAESKDSDGNITPAKTFNCDAFLPVQGPLKGKVVIKISCGINFSVAILDNGEVYSWGCNSDGQLGVNCQNIPYRTSPERVFMLCNIIIKKISCGASHVLAVSDVGELYTWGKNDSGQLGSGKPPSRHIPKTIEGIGKIIDIATTSTDSTSAAMNEVFKVYMWGYCGGLCLNVPKETQFETLHEVFANFGDRRIMYKPMTRQFQCQSILDTLKNSFNNAETSDLTIVAEGEKILVHKAILKMRSIYFKTMLNEPRDKDTDKEIEISQKYDVIYAYLEYLYTGDLKALPALALELLKIAEEYEDADLKKMSETCIKHGITTENVADLYILASKSNAKKLAKHCLAFASNHMSALIESKGFRQWDKETLIEFVVECQKRKMFKS